MVFGQKWAWLAKIFADAQARLTLQTPLHEILDPPLRCRDIVKALWCHFASSLVEMSVKLFRLQLMYREPLVSVIHHVQRIKLYYLSQYAILLITACGSPG